MPTLEPLEVSDLIFSNAQSDVNKILGNIRRSALTVGNRLRSIQQDASFVETVAVAFGLPLVANERCGSWYISPDHKVQSAYFKSTDGHNGQWSFSLRRLNLQILETVIENGGCVIVDSTRRGKSMPDALSKTIPIWTCVLNRLFFPNHMEAREFHTPPGVVSHSEHSQIDSRIDDFVLQLQSLDLDLHTFQSRLKKPLRPLWVTQGSPLPLDLPTFPDFHAVVLCTASRQVPSSESSGQGYIQGAADDSESWAHGLTAPLFWKHKEELLATPEEELPTLIAQLLKTTDRGTSHQQSTPIKPATQLHIGRIETAELAAPSEYSLIITCSPQGPRLDTKHTRSNHLHLPCAPGKIGSRQLRHELPKILPVLDKFLLDEQRHSQTTTITTAADPTITTTTATNKILIACPTGKDHSLGIALAILCLYFSTESGKLTPRDPDADKCNKHFIKQRLSWIMVALPDANPSRTTLQSVNSFLLG